MRRTALIAVLCAAAVTGCGADGSSSDGRLGVIATTTQLGDLARQVAGDDARVTQVL
jgi:ABC-type Zn uptake system ZnuABC Zn-binding protein ZnuA